MHKGLAWLALGFLACGGNSRDGREIVELPPFEGHDLSNGGSGPSARPTPFAPVFDDVRTAATPPPPLSGGTLAVLADGTRAVASDPDRDHVYVVDLTARSIVNDVALEPGEQPGRIVEDGAGRVHVVLRGRGQLLTLSGARLDVASRVDVCPAPRGVAYEPAGDRLHVACAGGELVTLAAAGGAPVRRVRLDRDLRDVVVAGNRLFVSRFRASELLEIGSDGRVLARDKPPEALNLFRRQLAGSAGPAKTRFVPTVAWRTLPSPDGRGAIMLHQRSFTGEISIEPGTSEYGGSDCSAIVQTAISVVRPGSEPSLPSATLANAVLPIDMALSRDGRRVAIVSVGDAHAPTLGSEIIVGRLAEMTPVDRDCLSDFQTPPSGPSLPRADAGATAPTDAGAPDAQQPAPAPAPESIEVTWSPDGVTFARNRIRGGEAVAVAFSGAGEVVVQTREPAALVIGDSKVVIPLARSSRYDTGHAVFHSNTGTQIACAACHPEGGDDGHVWRFSRIGSRRTQSLRGGLLATAPLHWDGDMSDIGQIMRDVFTGRMAGPQLSVAHVAAVGRWLDRLAVPARSPAADAAAAERGRTLFQSPAVGCATCHSGAQLTNNQTVDVGTGGRFQVPSLVDVASRAPFMHDGCAPTLLDRFRSACGGNDQHGVVSNLTEAELRDLAAYLETL